MHIIGGTAGEVTSRVPFRIANYHRIEKRFVLTKDVVPFNPPPLTIGVQNYLPDSQITQGIQEAMILSCARVSYHHVHESISLF